MEHLQEPLFSTRQVLEALRSANPGVSITEDRIRQTIRRGDIPRPGQLAHNYVWTAANIAALSAELGLESPFASEEAIDE